MAKVKIVFQNNNKEIETEVEKFDAVELHKLIIAYGETLVPIGNVLVNKHHIECVYEID